MTARLHPGRLCLSPRCSQLLCLVCAVSDLPCRAISIKLASLPFQVLGEGRPEEFCCSRRHFLFLVWWFMIILRCPVSTRLKRERALKLWLEHLAGCWSPHRCWFSPCARLSPED